jgi:uncharacterized protein (TIGR02118 family)
LRTNFRSFERRDLLDASNRICHLTEYPRLLAFTNKTFMIKVSILYLNTPGARFDFDYYVSKHMPRSIELLSAHPGIRSVTVERGISGPKPDSSPAYIAACFYTFDSIESFLDAFMPHAEELQGDMKNYTDIEPQIQFNEIHIERPSINRR